MEKTIDRILVPIDFSDYSLNACYFAMHLSVKHNAEVMLFHAFFNPMVDAMTFPDAFTYQSNMAEVFHELEQNARREIKKFANKLKRYARLKNLENLEVKTEVAAGQPADEIENIIKIFNPGLIVIGTRGHGKRPADLLGSVATRVIDSGGTPVLLVTQDAALSEGKPIKILYATNFDDTDYKALESLVRTLSGYSISIECVHFSTTTDDREYEKETEKLAETRRYFNTSYSQIPLQCHIIKNKNIQGGLESFVKDADIDLIAITHKKRSLFYRLLNPSLAKKLLFQTKTPVFVFN
jgi:nucleotide-binding universal stress UspA family protein